MSSRAATIIQADLAGVPKPIRHRVTAFRILIALGIHLRGLMDRRLAPSGITTQQAAVLTIASAAATPLTQGELAAHLGVSHQNVRQLTDALARKGLVEVRLDPEDRRVKRVRPTRAVRALFARRDADDFEAVAGWFSALDDHEAEALVLLLGRLADGIATVRARDAATPRRPRAPRR